MYEAMFAAGIVLYAAVIFIKKKKLKAVFSGTINVLLAVVLAAAGAGIPAAAAFLLGVFFLDAVFLTGSGEKRRPVNIKGKIAAGAAAVLAAAAAVFYFSGAGCMPTEKEGFYKAGLLIFASCALLASTGITLLFYYSGKEGSGD